MIYPVVLIGGTFTLVMSRWRTQQRKRLTRTVWTV